MNRHVHHDSATSNVLAWTSHCANVEASVDEEAGADADEPPDRPPPPLSPLANHFKRAPIRRGSGHQESLLTRALQSHSDEDTQEEAYITQAHRRRSITSNFSLASTADLTCDTGITTPARTNSPSPRLPDVGFVPVAGTAAKGVAIAASPRLASKNENKVVGAQKPKDPAVVALEKKRCISFACAAKPKVDDRVLMPPPPKPSTLAPKPEAQPPVKRPTISFACSARPPRTTPPARKELACTPVPPNATSAKEMPSTTVNKHRSPSTVRAFRSTSSRRTSQSPARARGKKILRANSRDLQSEGARFHEFASDEPQEDDWILHDNSSLKRKITISDTLEKENAIRKLGKEAEEEAELEDQIDEEEEEDEDEDADGDVDNGDDEIGDLEEDEDDGYSGYGSDDDASDGYNTDNEVGFADSEDDDDDLVLWNTGKVGQLSLSGATPVRRRASFADQHSDSSALSSPIGATIRAKSRGRRGNITFRPGTPELPDSTDFVCGTLDEDRPLEEAYISCLAARKQKKHHPIPQDIDPSFPASEPEDAEEDEYEDKGVDSDDELIHGELEDLHHDQDRLSRKKKTDAHSPKRLRSPPPKRLHSPPPKARGRSPKRLFDRQSPRRLRSPAPPLATQSPPGSPVQAGEGIAFKTLAFRPGLTHTKSLPRSPALFLHMNKHRRGRAGTVNKHNHVRGAIDIVKGLEQKRQRRKEKFNQKYCTRARKEKAQEKRPPPGQGAERMREIGLLLMASKNGQGNYVLSV